MSALLRLVLKRLSSKGGFTLIEMMVVTTVVGILLAGGIARYRQFDSRQRVVAGGKGLAQYLRVAQKKAKSGNKPSSGCATLYGYRVNILAGGNVATMDALCDGGSTVVPDSNTFNIESDLQFTVTANPVFLLLSGGVDNASTVGVANSDLSTEYQIELMDFGAITELGIQ